MQKYTEKKPNSKHLKSLKNGISYIRALRIKRICSKTTELEYLLQELKKRIVNQGYKEKSID